MYVWNLLALNVFISFNFNSSVFINPWYIFIIVIIVDINSAIIIIDFIPAPDQIIMIGPSAILGKLFIKVKNGSIIFASVWKYQSIDAIIITIIVPNIKLMNVYMIVIAMWLNKLFSYTRLSIVIIISVGLLVMNESINSFLVPYSHKNININTISICILTIVILYHLFLFKYSL